MMMMHAVARSTMKQLGLSLSERDVQAMMRSVGVGPHGKISYPGISHVDYVECCAVIEYTVFAVKLLVVHVCVCV